MCRFGRVSVLIAIVCLAGLLPSAVLGQGGGVKATITYVDTASFPP